MLKVGTVPRVIVCDWVDVLSEVVPVRQFPVGLFVGTYGHVGRAGTSVSLLLPHVCISSLFSRQYSKFGPVSWGGGMYFGYQGYCCAGKGVGVLDAGTVFLLTGPLAVSG